MNYIILSNVGLALMIIIVYFRYAKLKISASREISNLRANMERRLEEKQEAEDRLFSETKIDHDKIEKLLREIDELRKGKEGEIKLRFELEKQLEVAVQKTVELQNRIEDRRAMQEVATKDSKEVITKIGNDLYKKMSDSYKVEVETNKNLIGRVSENITKFFEKNLTMKSQLGGRKNLVAGAASLGANDFYNQAIVLNPSSELITDLVSIMKATGLLANKDYFVPSNFDNQKAKLMLCDVAFIKQNKLYLIDFKACRYLAEYAQLKMENKVAADENLKNHFEKYFAYLGNEKYLNSILKALNVVATSFDKVIIAIIVADKAALQNMKEAHFYEKATKAGFEVFDYDGINNLIL